MAGTSHQTDSSPSPSPSPSSSSWNVFLSFCGNDEQKNFTGHLCRALGQAGIRTSAVLPRAIEDANISIIVLSKKYAASTRCLDELVMILDCRKRNGQTVLPLFYDRDPSVVRYQTGSFADAFQKHKKSFVDKVHRWQAALTEVADLSGYDMMKDANWHEAKLIQEIMEDIQHVNE